jgi:hypothetical protein
MTRGQIVEYNYIMTIFTKGIYDMAADIAGSTGHKDLHLPSFPAHQVCIRVELNHLHFPASEKTFNPFPLTIFAGPQRFELLTHNNPKINDRYHPSYVFLFPLDKGDRLRLYRQAVRLIFLF